MVYCHLTYSIFGKQLTCFVSGEGKSKKVAKNVAAEKMLKILLAQDNDKHSEKCEFLSGEAMGNDELEIRPVHFL